MGGVSGPGVSQAQEDPRDGGAQAQGRFPSPRDPDQAAPGELNGPTPGAHMGMIRVTITCVQQAQPPPCCPLPEGPSLPELCPGLGTLWSSCGVWPYLEALGRDPPPLPAPEAHRAAAAARGLSWPVLTGPSWASDICPSCL